MKYPVQIKRAEDIVKVFSHGIRVVFHGSVTPFRNFLCISVKIWYLELNIVKAYMVNLFSILKYLIRRVSFRRFFISCLLWKRIYSILMWDSIWRVKKKCIYNDKINEIIISKNIVHIAKSPNHEIDLYNDYLQRRFQCNWFIETWIRGHKYAVDTCQDINQIRFSELFYYREKQDHSKWAVSDKDYYFIGDLNRMTTQMKRGGGGFVCKNDKLSRKLREIAGV